MQQLLLFENNFKALTIPTVYKYECEEGYAGIKLQFIQINNYLKGYDYTAIYDLRLSQHIIKNKDLVYPIVVNDIVAIRYGFWELKYALNKEVNLKESDGGIINKIIIWANNMDKLFKDKKSLSL